MSSLIFYKMQGSGNDFILVDNRQGTLKDLRSLAPRLCRHKVSIGADGLIAIENSSSADFRMRIINADGSEAEMCGNGARCVARVAHLLGVAPAKMSFETLAGIIRAEVVGERVKIFMSAPHSLTLEQKLSLNGHDYTLYSINTGVPHAVVPWENLEEAPVTDLGRKIRFHSAFAPAGTNVNFIHQVDEHNINIRTYERGVEDETLACGTGSVAAALVKAALGWVSPPVSLHPKSGEVLTINFDWDGKEFKNVCMEGAAVLVYKGELVEG
jgi:diaminopimelate epimerase